MKNNNLYLASNIKFLRLEKGKTQQDLADVCGKNNTAVSNWEKGIREPDAVDLGKISNYFNISVDDLMLKDLRVENKTFDEFDILFSKYKDILTDEDKEYMKFIIEKRKREIDKQLGDEE